MSAAQDRSATGARRDSHCTPSTLRRCSLVVPASSQHKLGKALALGADEVVIDLEDAVAVTAKVDARGAAAASLSGLGARPPEVSVRVNAPGTPWCHADVVALAALDSPPASIVVPKVETAGDLAFIERLVDGVEAGRPTGMPPLRIQALIETSAALARVHEIACASRRLDALIVGYADLAASLGRSTAGARDTRLWDSIDDTVLIAARANGLLAIDGPELATEPGERLHAIATRARDRGMDGKWAIHPAQVPVITELFNPTDEEVTRPCDCGRARGERARLGPGRRRTRRRNARRGGARRR